MNGRRRNVVFIRCFVLSNSNYLYYLILDKSFYHPLSSVDRCYLSGPFHSGLLLYIYYIYFYLTGTGADSLNEQKCLV